MPELHDERIRRTSKEMLNKVFSDEDIAQLQKMIPKSINGFDIRFEINLEPPIIPEEFDGSVRTADILFELQVELLLLLPLVIQVLLLTLELLE